MKKFIFINGKTAFTKQFENIEAAITYSHNHLDQSKEIVIREVDNNIQVVNESESIMILWTIQNLESLAQELEDDATYKIKGNRVSYDRSKFKHCLQIIEDFEVPEGVVTWKTLENNLNTHCLIK